jgi:hypothetical protein
MNNLKMWIGPNTTANTDYLKDCHTGVYQTVKTKLKDVDRDLAFMRKLVDMNKFALMADKGGIYVDVDVSNSNILTKFKQDGKVVVPIHADNKTLDSFFIIADKQPAKELLDRFIVSQYTDIFEYINSCTTNSDILVGVPYEDYHSIAQHIPAGSWCGIGDFSWLY